MNFKILNVFLITSRIVKLVVLSARPIISYSFQGIIVRNAGTIANIATKILSIITKKMFLFY